MTLNIGHRGAAGLEPENTLRSFRRAFAEGADAIELDLRLTRDGHLVVLHDATVDRTTGGAGAVAEMTLQEIRHLDAGLGERVPTFEEALEATGLPIHAELKAVEAAGPLAVLVRDRALAGRVTPISFDPEALRRVKRILPDLPVGLILAGAPPDPSTALSLGAALVSPEAAHLDAPPVEGYHRAGLRVTTWTVNDPREMRRARALGVDGVVTDYPDVLAGLGRARPRGASPRNVNRRRSSEEYRTCGASPLPGPVRYSRCFQRPRVIASPRLVGSLTPPVAEPVVPFRATYNRVEPSSLPGARSNRRRLANHGCSHRGA